MKFKGSSVYDERDFFETYLQKRNQDNSPNKTLEEPIVEALLGEVKGKDVLDLGCGDGAFGKLLLDRGARSYHGVDGSQNMISAAKALFQEQQASWEQKTLESFIFQKGKYDLVVSRLVFHYIDQLEPILQGIYQSLRQQGALICSIEHPVITSCYDAYHQETKRSNWIVDHYFSSGERLNTWIGKDVIKYHKTIEEYFQLFKAAGFEVSEIRESKPQEILFTEVAEYQRRMRIPLFMMFKLSK